MELQGTISCLPAKVQKRAMPKTTKRKLVSFSEEPNAISRDVIQLREQAGEDSSGVSDGEGTAGMTGTKGGGAFSR
jgi:hypothetical protein